MQLLQTVAFPHRWENFNFLHRNCLPQHAHASNAHHVKVHSHNCVFHLHLRQMVAFPQGDRKIPISALMQTTAENTDCSSKYESAFNESFTNLLTALRLWRATRCRRRRRSSLQWRRREQDRGVRRKNWRERFFKKIKKWPKLIWVKARKMD